MITAEDIRKIAQLAHLEISEDEVALYTPQMASIVQYVEQLSELETENIEAALGGLTEAGMQTDSARNDVPKASLGQTSALSQAPDANSGPFRVPKVL